MLISETMQTTFEQGGYKKQGGPLLVLVQLNGKLSQQKNRQFLAFIDNIVYFKTSLVNFFF